MEFLMNDVYYLPYLLEDALGYFQQLQLEQKRREYIIYFVTRDYIISQCRTKSSIVGGLQFLI